MEIKCKSELLNIKQGIPQGSILGPLLFITFINSLPESLPRGMDCIIFADDTTVLVPETHHLLRTEGLDSIYKTIEDICNSMNLKINQTKTIAMDFSCTSQETNQDTTSLTKLSHTKFLGIEIDSNLTWKFHIEALQSKLSTSLFALRRIVNLTNFNTAKIAYHALFESHLRFGIVAWGAANLNLIQKILTTQKKL